MHLKGIVIQELNKLGNNKLLFRSNNSKGNSIIKRGYKPILKYLLYL